MKINLSKLSEKGKGFINNKTSLLVLSAMLIAAIAFSLFQVTQAGVTGPHNPGHTWGTIDKPSDCSSGQYVYGANDTGWLCSTLPTSQNCSVDGVCANVYATYDVNAGDDLYAADDVYFYGDLLPEGTNCSAGQTVQKIASGQWGCATVSLPTGSSGQTLRHDGTNWVANSNIYNNGTNVGIGITSPSQKLHSTGYIRADSGFCIGANCITSWSTGGTLSCTTVSRTGICDPAQYTLNCPSGYTVTGGGISGIGTATGINNYPTANGWTCFATNLATIVNCTCYARCCMLQ